MRPAAPNRIPIINDNNTEIIRLNSLYFLAFCRQEGILAASIISKRNEARVRTITNENMCSFLDDLNLLYVAKKGEGPEVNPSPLFFNVQLVI
jgi:hypothetical protein